MKRIYSIPALASALVALALVESGQAAPAPAPASTSTPATSPGPETPSAKAPMRTGRPEAVGEKVAAPGTDQSFLQRAAEMNLYEIELGKIAERAASNPEIRKLAQEAIKNHTAANQQLGKLAAAKGITLPSSPSKMQQRKIAMLESKKGAQFDKAFLQDQVQSTQQSISTYEREHGRTADPEIKEWAQSMLPKLKDHLAVLQTSRPEAVGEQKGKAVPRTESQPRQKRPSNHGGGN